MRIVKAPEERREELLDASQALFEERGVDATSVNDIIVKAGVAKGTFYWYFKSKDALLDALAERKVSLFIDKIQPILTNAHLDALEKLREAFARHESICHAHHALREHFHRPENMALHQKHADFERERLCPLLAAIIAQGVSEGIFSTDYPETAAEFLLVALRALIHPPIGAKDQERTKRCAGIRDIMERSLGAPAGTLSFLLDG